MVEIEYRPVLFNDAYSAVVRHPNVAIAIFRNGAYVFVGHFVANQLVAYLAILAQVEMHSPLVRGGPDVAPFVTNDVVDAV